jgi:hypothetical protein
VNPAEYIGNYFAMKILKQYTAALPEVCARLGRAVVSSLGEPVSFDAFQVELILSVLETAVELHPDVSEHDRSLVFIPALSYYGSKRNSLTPAALEASIKRAESEYLKMPLRSYTFVSSPGMVGAAVPRNLTSRGVYIKFLKELPKRFIDESVLEDHENVLPPQPSVRLIAVTARLQARTESGAYERASQSLDLVRASWNFVLNSRTITKLFFSTEGPVNRILPGPIHTVYSPDGTRIPGLWYERYQLRDHWLYRLDGKWSGIEERARKMRTRLSRMPYGRDIERALIRDGRALDHPEPAVSFNRLWSVLEYLTDSVGNYERLIARTSWLMSPSEQQFIRVLGQHLRDVRNGMVHHDRDRSQIQTYVYQLKWLTEALFRFHFRSGSRFRSLGGASAVLDLTSDERELRRQILERRWALKRLTAQRKTASPARTASDPTQA